VQGAEGQGPDVRGLERPIPFDGCGLWPVVEASGIIRALGLETFKPFEGYGLQPVHEGLWNEQGFRTTIPLPQTNQGRLRKSPQSFVEFLMGLPKR
jgi:hypothetical protein